MKKRVYSTEFKSEAVRLSYQRENIKELADELGVQVQRIYKWRAGQKTKASPKATIKLETDSIEVKRLRKALKKKELELEILKKAVHIFSKSDGNVGFPFL
jgi:transposase